MKEYKIWINNPVDCGNILISAIPMRDAIQVKNSIQFGANIKETKYAMERISDAVRVAAKVDEEMRRYTTLADFDPFLMDEYVDLRFVPDMDWYIFLLNPVLDEILCSGPGSITVRHTMDMLSFTLMESPAASMVVSSIVTETLCAMVLLENLSGPLSDYDTRQIYNVECTEV